MRLTNEQYEFFKDLDVEEAIQHGEGLVQFSFRHKGRAVTIMPYSVGEADIIVRPPRAAPDSNSIDRTLSLQDIPGTQNMSGPALIQLIHTAVLNHSTDVIKNAWAATPYVRRWRVETFPKHTKFMCYNGPTSYVLCALEDPDTPDSTIVQLFVNWVQVHTFHISEPYVKQPTVQGVFDLADTITAVWRDAVGEQVK